MHSTPFSPKSPYGHRETRSNSALLATHKTQLVPLCLPLVPSTGQDISSKSIKSSLLGTEDASENKPVVHAPTTADLEASPLRDACQQSFVSDRTTLNVCKVLNYLSKPTLHKSRMEFHSIGAREFGLIEGIVGETAQVSIKPRRVQNLHPTVSVLHDATFDILRVFIDHSINGLPYDPDVITPMIHMGWPLKIPGASIMSDMSMSLTPVEERPDEVLIPFFGECAFSETDAHVFQKAENMVLAHPEVKCVTVVLVHEATEYAPPPVQESTVSKALFGGTDSNPKPLTLGEFLYRRNRPRSFGEPIVIGGHTWCHLSSVEFFLWVKRDDESPINVRSGDPPDMAYGTLVPEIDMDAVTEMLERGLTKIRDSFVAFQKKLEPSLNSTALAETKVRSRANWVLASKRIMTASEVTAHTRYLTWYDARFGTESDNDPPYVDSETEDGEKEPEIIGTKRPSTSSFPCSRRKIKKT